ncbi:MAG: 1-(5-phosphoribosyl)-5-[(5-phosphoribosylamino)methylideneamino]imidazole-4-carboxamide isomerase, partial [bacterium]|nr:1-(5-phosphoribosyl)-5-[(5-phosphoribosylamino)methylideneamino]imidazole-4-carboxamide isomerase [bacterium]
GKCVRLFQGDFNKETIYDNDPVKVALEWKNQGAKKLHIVDLDGAKFGKLINIEIIKKIIEKTQLPVQVGGGIRDVQSFNRLYMLGINNVILGTTALENESLFKQIININKKKIIVSIDCKNGIVMKNGWLEKSYSDLIQTIKQLEEFGLEKIIYTDIKRDGTITEPNYDQIKVIKNITKMNLIVAGGITSIYQIIKLQKMKIDGVIIGKALYENKINLKEVLKNVN